MTKKVNTKRALLMSALALLLCVSMLIGSTFAWFTDSVVSGSNVITAGNLDLEVQYTLDGENWAALDGATDIFQKGLWEPGHTEVVALKVENNGTLALKYNANMNILNETVGKTKDGKDIVLSDILTVTTINHQVNMIGDILLGMVFDGAQNTDSSVAKSFKSSSILTKDQELAAGEAHYLFVIVDMAETVGNEANHNGVNIPSINFGINVLAAQFTSENDSFGNQYDKDAEYPALADAWDGTADISWFLENPDATEYTIDSAEELAGFRELINGTAAIPATVDTDLYEALNTKNFVLTTDVDLSGQNFVPIGGVDKGVAFEGVFDGGDHTIYGLTQNGWDLGYSYGQTAGMGLFGWVGDATIKNLKIDDAEISMEAVVMGTVAGYAAGDCTFKDITVTNTQLANYNWDTGGIVGQAYGSGSKFVFENINIDETNTISGHWGTWDVSAGGVIGRTADGVSVEMKKVNVACVLDVFNDVCAAYQWYAYRYSGMLVGYTKTTATNANGTTVATAPHVKCEDVTVTYGDWMNYTYCQPSNVYPQYVRVQGGYSTDPYYSGRHWTAGVDAAGNVMCEVETHVHAEGQAHDEVIPFDQLFGGGQGVYGTATHDGVTVVYPASYIK